MEAWFEDKTVLTFCLHVPSLHVVAADGIFLVDPVMAPSFIESGFTSKVEYEASLKGNGSVAPIFGEPITLGYHKIRGLAAALRMMFFYKKVGFKHVDYAEDMKSEWFGKDKPELIKANSMINLPYLIDGSTVVTQSNSCLLYLGQRLGIDTAECMIHNHQVLDQTMDLRNELMKIVYNPACQPFKEHLEKHMGTAGTHFAKLEGFAKGPYMCGAAVQSGDFHVFEMLDQHIMSAPSVRARARARSTRACRWPTAPACLT